MRRNMMITASLGAALALALTACANDEKKPQATGGETAAANCEAYKDYGDLKGKTVSVYATFVDTEGQAYENSFRQFEACTGAEIKYEGSKSFTDDLPKRVQAGSVPDLAVFPQPGLLADTVASGKLKEAPASVAENVDKFWTESWRDYGTVDSKLYAAPLGASMKSFVWYSPSEFEAAGYKVPETWDDLIKLTTEMASKGETKPWCAGIEDGQATGWVATDWVEDMVLREAGGEVYDQWVKHEIPFDAPQVVAALTELSKVLRDPKNVNAGLGDVKSIATTSWPDAGIPVYDKTCYMHRQASFYGQNYADVGATVAEDGDIWAFFLPSKDGKSRPIVGGGDFVGAFDDREEVVAFQTYLSSAEWANEKAKVTEAGWTTANNGLERSNLKSPIDRLAAELLADPNAEFRFDGSDLMPAEVGSGAFWTQMTAFFAENKAPEAVAKAIDEAWPKS